MEKTNETGFITITCECGKTETIAMSAHMANDGNLCHDCYNKKNTYADKFENDSELFGK